MMNDNLHMSTINRIDVYERIQEISDKFLTSFQEAYITMFANEAKRIADNALDDYIHSQENLYTSDSLDGIKDVDVLLRFTDIQTGYRRQMQKWVKSNPIEVKKMVITADNIPDDIPLMEQAAFKRAMSTFGLGTLGVVGLRFVTGSNWIWLIELAVLAASGGAFASGKSIDDERRMHMKEVWIKSKKQQIICSIKQDLDSWFDAAEIESCRIVESFNFE